MRFALVVAALLAPLAGCSLFESAEKDGSTVRPLVDETIAGDEDGSTVGSLVDETMAGDEDDSTVGSLVDETIAGGAGDEAQVTSVLDGDTFEAIVGGETERIRLIGLDAPENGECSASEALAALQGLLGGRVWLFSDQSDRDQYGRLLRYVRSNDVFVNEELIRQGMAIARTYPPDDLHQGDFELAQSDAESSERGLWDPAACGPATGSLIAITQISADPPGADEDDINGEYVDLTNQGSVDLDLSGWTIRDESASHRFSVPDGFSLVAGATVRLHTGCGEPTNQALYWCMKDSMVWNNDGDTVFVLDLHGNVVVSRNY